MTHRLPPALALFALAGVIAIASSAGATPMIKPLEGEPIIRTFDPNAVVATPVVAPAAEAPKPVEEAKPVTAAKPVEADEAAAVTTRMLVLYGIVVVSLLGIAVISILLILRKGRRNESVRPPPSLAPLAVPNEPSGRFSIGEPAWTQPPLGSDQSTNAPRQRL